MAITTGKRHEMDDSRRMLVISRHRLRLRAQRAITWPRHAGPAWRGAFGHALRRRACITGAPDCAGCLFAARCAYPQVFETAPGSAPSFLQAYRDAPRPWVLRPENSTRTERGELVTLELNVFESGNRHLPLMSASLADAAQQGISDARVPLDPVAFETLTPPPEPPSSPASVHIVVETPIRVRRNREEVSARRFSPGDLLMPLLRRISQLRATHGRGPLDVDFKALRSSARSLHWHNPQWHDIREHRYSSRQRRHVPITGVVGQAQLDTGNLDAWWPLLWTGQWTHVGKGAVMGMGAYRLKIFESDTGHQQTSC